MADMKPKWPSCDGRQFATEGDAGHYVSMGYDSEGNEMPSDPQMMHENSTPGNGSSNYSAKHYSDDFEGGYGVSVGTPSPSRETTTVNAQSTERGKES